MNYSNAYHKATKYPTLVLKHDLNLVFSEYAKGEELYLRSEKVSLKLFGPGYSGLEYDYKGLLRIYEQTRVIKFDPMKESKPSINSLNVFPRILLPSISTIRSCNVGRTWKRKDDKGYLFIQSMPLNY